MIKRIKFKNFRNLNTEYLFTSSLQIIFGANNTGKTNILDGIRLAFSSITNDYFKIKKSDFTDSDDNKEMVIDVELFPDAIPSLTYFERDGKKCGFSVRIVKTESGRYKRNVYLLNGSQVDMEIVREDPKLPVVSSIPLIRTEDIFTNGLTVGIKNLIASEERYRILQKESKEKILDEMKEKIDVFKGFCTKFNQDLDIDFSEPRLTDEKAYVVDGEKEHNYCIGSGYKSIANIILNTLGNDYNIILIDEIENHLHPALVRTLLREIRSLSNAIVVATTHSPIVINEAKTEELISVEGIAVAQLDKDTQKKLNTFLHPGRAEIVFSDNIILVEGYTEELLLKYFLQTKNYNWTIVNVAGVMFKPYILLAMVLKKHVLVISDDDRVLAPEDEESTRFKNLRLFCKEKEIRLIRVFNTLESDLYENGYLEFCPELLEDVQSYAKAEIKVARQNCKMQIALSLIDKEVVLSEWHVIREIEDEFKSN